MISIDGYFNFSDDTETSSPKDSKDESSSPTSETDTYSNSDNDCVATPLSEPTDHSLSPSPTLQSMVKKPKLAIDKVDFLKPIRDSALSEQEAIAREERGEEQDNNKENDRESSSKSKLKRRKLNWKLKRTKSIKVWNGFTKILSLFAGNSIIKEKQMKEICHKEITEFLNEDTKKSRHCSIIRNFEIFDEKRVCDITKDIFTNSNYQHLLKCDQNEDGEDLEPNKIVDIWNIGLIMLFMINGKKNIQEMIEKDLLNNLDDLKDFMWNIYVENKLSTNLFDLLYFYMLICCDDLNERNSRYSQITNHSWFN